MKNLRTLFSTLSLCFILNIAVADELLTFETELLQTQIATARSILNLTPEQEQEFSKVLQTAAKQRQQTLKKYDISMKDENKARLNLREKRALIEDMRKLKINFEGQLEDVLSADQLRLFQEIQKKNQQVLKERLRSKIN